MADGKTKQYSRMLTIGDKQIFKNSETHLDLDDTVSKIDKSWIKSVFMISGADLDPNDAKNRYFSSAEMKFTDTSLGGNIGINSRPQFTRYCDIRSQGRRMDRSPVTINQKGNIGMGSYYSEAIDDNSQNLYLEFGVPKFNSLFTFFSRSIDPQAVSIARTGSPSTMYTAGQILGGAAVFLMLPVISVAIWSIKALVGVIVGDSSFNYYYLNSTMHTYWATVNAIVMNMSTELGILIPTFMPQENKGGIGAPVKVSQTEMDEIHKLLPGVIGEDNYIDVFAIATKAQKMANKQLDIQRKANESFKTSKEFLEKTSTALVPNEGHTPFKTWMLKLMEDSKDLFQVKEEPKKQDTAAQSDTNATAGKGEAQPAEANQGTRQYDKLPEDDKDGETTKALDYFKSAAVGGGSHAIFKVDYVGSINESFSNSVTDIPAASKLKSISRSAKEMNFSFAGGNIGGGMGNVVDGAKNLLTGGLSGLTFGLSNSLATLFGDAYMDIPKMWDDSSAQLPKLSYTMQLVSPYGNVISQLQNMYIPLAMLLAGVLPLATGKNSYTSPFICKAFLKGMHNVQLGMITDLSITRGTTNLAFNKQKRVLSLDVSFSITDFSQMMTAPIDNSLFGGAFNSGSDENSVFGRYISTLASRDLLTNMYAIPKAKMNLSRMKYGLDQATSASYWGFRAGEIANSVVGFALSDKALGLSDRN